MIYNELTNQVLSQSKTVTAENNYEINSSDISYDRNLNKISINLLKWMIKPKMNLFSAMGLFDTLEKLSSKVAIKWKS